MIKNFQKGNKTLNDVVNQLQEKIVSLESKSNSVEQYGRRNKMEISGIPNSNSDDINVSMYLIKLQMYM